LRDAMQSELFRTREGDELVRLLGGKHKGLAPSMMTAGESLISPVRSYWLTMRVRYRCNNP
jgi:hypothetical protein